jgi:hypothetical protein
MDEPSGLCGTETALIQAQLINFCAFVQLPKRGQALPHLSLGQAGFLKELSAGSFNENQTT